ncbi:MAG TPA: DUF4252 domain-containing protein [Bryobacteraceae bacterium]|nr:DUF4252 domain-containing protein [Bryobacteraceae bacterium]
MKVHYSLLGMASLVVLTPLLAAQTNGRLRIDWDKFAARASDRTEVTLDGGMLRAAASFLSDDDKDAKDVRKLLAGLRGVYIHSYTFSHDNEYPSQDVDSLRRQLQDGNWGRIVQSVKRDTREHDEIYLRNMKNDADFSGLVVLVAQPREFTLVEISGRLDPKDLGKLDGVLHLRRDSASEDEN